MWMTSKNPKQIPRINDLKKIKAIHFYISLGRDFVGFLKTYSKTHAHFRSVGISFL